MTRYPFDPVLIEDLLTPQECQDVIAYGESLGLADGDAYFPREEPSQRVDLNVRVAQSVMLPHNEDTAWLVERINAAIAEINKTFEFDLSKRIPVELMFCKYPVGGHFGVHLDNMGAVSARKLSCSIQLSQSADYEGGELVVFGSPNARDGESRAIGGMTGFPSFVMHKVRKVTQGTRYCLVVWAFGNRHFR